MSSIDQRQFRDALGRFATGVVVITAQGEDGPAGFTCQSFSSLSLDPPLAVFSATSTSSSWGKLRTARELGISVLSADQVALATQFATSGVDKFAGVSWHVGGNGAPLIDGALAHVEGSIESITAQGDHDLVVVAVSRVASFDGEPALYFKGTFQFLN